MTPRPVKRLPPRPGDPAPKPSSLSSTQTAPVSANAEDEVDKINIASLTLDTPLRPFKRRVPAKPLPFLTLPSELRIKIYAYYFDDTDGEVLDLGPDNYKRLHKRLGLVRVCKQVHDEATYYFYSTRSFRIFPTYPGRYFKAKKPLLARLKPVQRENITSLQLRLGPGWNAPPRGWVVNDALGLRECVNVHKLNVFVECDPSDNIFKGFRRFEGFYERFCHQLLGAILDEMPNVKVIEFDAWSSVKKSGNMMQQLLDVTTQYKRIVSWGPERGWTDNMDEDDSCAPAIAFAEGIPIPGYGSVPLPLAA